MHIEESTLPGGHVVMEEVCEDCPKCGKEMMNIVFIGEVCSDCEPPIFLVPTKNEN